LNYILKWLTDERLKICKKSQDGFKILIISEEEEKPSVLKNSKIYKHVFDSAKKIWTRKSN